MKASLAPKPAKRVRAPLLPYDVAVGTGAIEPGVRPLTDALNDAGAEPMASCEGHATRRQLFWPGVLRQNAFVLFRAPQDLARSIAQRIAHGYGLHNELHYVWHLRGYFYPEDWSELVWVIEPRDARIPDEWDCAKVAADFDALAAMVRAIGQAQAGRNAQ